jgi:translation initiation factor IF-1
MAQPMEMCDNSVSRESKTKNEVAGTVVEAVPNGLFRVRLTDGRNVLAHIGEVARVGIVRLIPGDRVVLETTAYDPSRARIVARAGGKQHESIGLG